MLTVARNLELLDDDDVVAQPLDVGEPPSTARGHRWQPQPGPRLLTGLFVYRTASRAAGALVPPFVCHVLFLAAQENADEPSLFDIRRLRTDRGSMTSGTGDVRIRGRARTRPFGLSAEDGIDATMQLVRLVRSHRDPARRDAYPQRIHAAGARLSSLAPNVEHRR